jgi:hypothetical protein
MTSLKGVSIFRKIIVNKKWCIIVEKKMRIHLHSLFKIRIFVHVIGDFFNR